MSPKSNGAASQKGTPYVLGLDLGTDSIGWAVLEWDGAKPTAIRRLGVRRFEAGVSGNIEAGRDEAPGSARRTARQQRRQLWRRAWRMRQVFRILSAAGLLPASGDGPDERDKTIKALDQELAKEHLPPAGNGNRMNWHLLAYRLRAAGAEGPLKPFALGRAIYHLAARRGYQSNLKAKKDEKEGVVRSGIGELEQILDGRTLGQYFATLDPEEMRIRQRYTSRKMYLDEFERIWSTQAGFDPQRLNHDLKKKIHAAIFSQRPLKSQRGLVGMCEREPGQRRAPLATLVAQRFRMLQKVNDLEIEMNGGELRKLSHEERAKLIESLMQEGDMKWAAIRRLLGLKGPRGEFRGDRFNFEEGGDKSLVGNRTAAKMFKVLGEGWSSLSGDQQHALVDEVLSFTNEDALVRRLQKVWNLSKEQAESVTAISLEQGYASLSRRAMEKLLPKLEQGHRLQTAMKEIYGTVIAVPKLDLLPPVHPSRNPKEKNSHPAFTQLRNPTVSRALTELRKVVNAIIREYGKPAQVRLELARELKKSRKDRQEIQSLIKANEKARDDARKQLLDERSEKFCTPHNILKLRLAEECRWICPYTGKPISMDTLLGDHPQFDVEHIYPFSWSLDNSYANKTLCHVDYNRNVKKNQTPFVAVGHSPDWPEILNRVRRFTGSAAREKLRRFLNEEVNPDFCQRQLSETRYISRLAANYLELLYGGRSDADHQQRVFVRTGQATAYLRAELKFNTLLGDPNDNDKSRSDHRHHAIDALVVALTDQGTIQQLAASAEKAATIGRRLLVPIEPPWPSILDDLRKHLDGVHISSRVNRKLAGQLHKATIFSKPKFFTNAKGKKVTVHHVRKPLVKMSRGEIEDIVDDRIRELVQVRLERIGLEPGKAFQDSRNLPYLTAHDGRIIPIRKARIRVADKAIEIGSGTASRYAAPGKNHHMEIIAVPSDDGSVKKWEGVIVSRFEAHQRQAKELPVIERDHGPDKRFLFSLAGGEHVMMKVNGSEKPDLFRVKVISKGRIEFIHHLDARPETERRKPGGGRVNLSPNEMRKQGTQKVVVDPLGNILPAND